MNQPETHPYHHEIFAVGACGKLIPFETQVFYAENMEQVRHELFADQRFMCRNSKRHPRNVLIITRRRTA